MDWLNQANQFLIENRSFYFYLALGGSVIFVIQLLFSLFGGADSDADSGADADTDFDASDIDLGDAGALSMVSFFSLRSIIAFLTFFGWAGYFWGDRGWGGLAIAVFAGAVMMVLTTLLVWFFLRMQQSGNLRTADFLDRTGTVYLGIPAGRAAGGMVTVNLEGCTRQVRAVADEALPTGTNIRIQEAIGPECFLVKKV